MTEHDAQYQETIIEEVRVEPDRYLLKYDGFIVLSCPKVDGLPAPKVGETLRTYGRGMGYIVRGIVVNGRVYRYRTAAEELARFQFEQLGGSSATVN